MDDQQLLRYSRQIMLGDVDVVGQNKLLSAHALIVGIGGLGSPAALYLAAAGIGELTLCDHDTVELSNLQRQIAHSTATLGSNKAASAREHILALSPGTRVNVVEQRMDTESLAALVTEADIVLDCTDNFEVRYAINDLCWQAAVPLVSGAAIRWEGQITVFDPRSPDSPCYRCLYSSGDDAALTCSENGVIAPLVGIIGACQALEAIKHVIGIGETLVGHVLYFDAKYMEWRKLKLSKRPGCELCGRADRT